MSEGKACQAPLLPYGPLISATPCGPTCAHWAHVCRVAGISTRGRGDALQQEVLHGDPEAEMRRLRDLRRLASKVLASVVWCIVSCPAPW